MAQETRKVFRCLGFIEVETPVLDQINPRKGRVTLLVPAAWNPGEFYALTQIRPKPFKQLLDGKRGSIVYFQS